MGSPRWKGRSVTPATARAKTAHCGHSPAIVTTSNTFSWGPLMTTSTSLPDMTVLLPLFRRQGPCARPFTAPPPRRTPPLLQLHDRTHQILPYRHVWLL